MKKVVIIGGQFATGKDKQGNFVAQTAEGEEIFVLKNRMDAIGITKDTPIAELEKMFPLYGLQGTRTFNQRNPNFDPKDKDSKEFLEETTTRPEIKRVFKSLADLVHVTTLGERIKVEEIKVIKQLRKDAELTDEEIQAIANESIGSDFAEEEEEEVTTDVEIE
jgi:hypothetical protein